jgi:YD repeat-containing protein
MKILWTILALALLTGHAFAQQRTFYDARGKVVGRTATDSQKTTTFYDAAGRKVGQATKGSR